MDKFSSLEQKLKEMESQLRQVCVTNVTIIITVVFVTGYGSPLAQSKLLIIDPSIVYGNMDTIKPDSEFN